MKNFITSCLLLCLSFSITAQSPAWHLFPQNLPTFYKTSDQLVNCYFNDSTVQKGSADLLFFQKNTYTEPWGDCLQPFIDEVNYPKNITDNMLLHSDSVLETAGLFSVFQGGDTLRFDSKATVGDMLFSNIQIGTFDQVQFICAALGEQELFGVMDSVKTYHVSAWTNGVQQASPLDTLRFVLSKHHGFVSFVPFYFLKKGEFDHQWDMIGFVEGTDNYGFTNSFQDYTSNYEVGDVLRWEERNPIQNPQYYCHRDSIESIERTDSTVKLFVYRNRQTIQRVYVGNPISGFKDSLVGMATFHTQIFLEKSYFDAFFGDYKLNSYDLTTGVTRPVLLTIQQDGSYTLNEYFDGIVYDVNTCLINGFADFGDGRRWNTAYGFLIKYSNLTLSDNLELTGYAKNGITLYGDVNLCYQTSSTKKVATFNFSIFPNPIQNEAVHIQLPNNSKITQASLFNLQGQLIWQGLPNVQNNPFELDFEEKMEAGVYFLKIQTDEGRVGVERIFVL